ncbi:MAG: ATP-binding cassette domain-containing protein, partial [Nitrospirae bacterium]|nr:ATP-binding cassette domain-containing protein [Nitrospirota bacterium]
MISVNHLVMRLAAGGRAITILDNISLEIPNKQMIAIVGPSGSGKSTLLGLIAGLDKPTSGSILLDGVEITALAESDMARYRRQNIGYIFQSFHLIPTLTALENAAVPLELNGNPKARERAAELLVSVGLGDR